MEVIKYSQIEDKIVQIGEFQAILDRDVAELYGVETKRVNEAISNNPDKFPDGYIIELSQEDWEILRSKFSTLRSKAHGQHSKYLPKAFTEKGLYMLATVLKSAKATQTTIAIIETFTKVRSLSQNMKLLANVSNKAQQKTLMQSSGEIMSELLDSDLATTDTETSIEINLAVMKFKHTVKKKQPKK